MKKLLLLTAFTLFLSCSKDDEQDPTTKELEINVVNVSGTWRIDKVIRADGGLEDYSGICPGTSMVITILEYGVLRIAYTRPDCVTLANDSASGWSFNAGYTFAFTGSDLEGMAVKSLTTTKMRTEYATPSPMQIGGNGTIKGLLLVKQ